MSDFLCKNCGAAMGLKKKGWTHYDDVPCDSPELDAEDSAIVFGPAPDSILRNAAHHLMDGTNIWYDLTPNEKGDMVHGPTRQAVTLLCQMASDLRREQL